MIIQYNPTITWCACAVRCAFWMILDVVILFPPLPLGTSSRFIVRFRCFYLVLDNIKGVIEWVSSLGRLTLVNIAAFMASDAISFIITHPFRAFGLMTWCLMSMFLRRQKCHADPPRPHSTAPEFSCYTFRVCWGLFNFFRTSACMREVYMHLIAPCLQLPNN